MQEAPHTFLDRPFSGHIGFIPHEKWFCTPKTFRINFRTIRSPAIINFQRKASLPRCSLWKFEFNECAVVAFDCDGPQYPRRKRAIAGRIRTQDRRGNTIDDFTLCPFELSSMVPMLYDVVKPRDRHSRAPPADRRHVGSGISGAALSYTHHFNYLHFSAYRIGAH